VSHERCGSSAEIDSRVTTSCLAGVFCAPSLEQSILECGYRDQTKALVLRFSQFGLKPTNDCDTLRLRHFIYEYNFHKMNDSKRNSTNPTSTTNTPSPPPLSGRSRLPAEDSVQASTPEFRYAYKCLYCERGGLVNCRYGFGCVSHVRMECDCGEVRACAFVCGSVETHPRRLVPVEGSDGRTRCIELIRTE
jgi:hypothetical protein